MRMFADFASNRSSSLIIRLVVREGAEKSAEANENKKKSRLQIIYKTTENKLLAFM